MFIARKSENIQEDIKRNWSSWNFGQLGFDGTIQELKAEMEKSLENETSFDISGFELWGDDIIKADIRELYQGYWVLVDNVNSPDGLSCIDLDATTLEDAITEAEKRTDYWGDGQSFDATEAKLVYSNNDIHIFEIDELRVVQITYEGGDIITTSMAGHLTNKEIENYFKVGKKFNIGSVEDKIRAVKSVVILK